MRDRHCACRGVPREIWLRYPARNARAARGVQEVYCHVLMVNARDGLQVCGNLT
jgi:hypothetical protein